MKKILKYQLNVNEDAEGFKWNGEYQELYLPFNNRFLSVGIQEETVVLWFLVDPTADPIKKRRFTVVGTGWELSDFIGSFRGTVQSRAGLVWHVFER